MLSKYIYPQLSILFWLVFLIPKASFAATPDTRSDSFNVTHYTITLDLSNLSTQSISGSCLVKGVSKINGLNRLSLELHKLIVDSIKQNGTIVPYQYNDSLLTVKPIVAWNAGDTFAIMVWYHGQPEVTSWGGFYFDHSDDYAFNLGIGLYTIPHNLGRVWFPCVDNFTDKATYSFYIQSKSGSKAFCNGLLIDSVLNINNTLTWHWEMMEPVVPYLAAVGIGPYKTIYSTYKSITGVTKPVVIGILPDDTTLSRTTFQHLPAVLSEYENAYGPYPFDRIGFVGVNFGSGAMEHASNISLPNSWIEGGLSDEYLWAHELSHQWWGDLATCSSAADMWLNEGWACYNEGFYQEKLYGATAYNQYAMGTRYTALRYAHIVDSTDRPLSPMPEKYTYGPTTYDKGSCVVRSLRNYLGDSLFYKGVKTYLQQDFKYSSASASDFEASLTKSTGVDMAEFFNEWVFGNGWPHFEITNLIFDTITTSDNIVSINLRTVDNNYQYSNTPLTMSYFNYDFSRHDISFKYSSTGPNKVKIPLGPQFFALDLDGKVTDATTKQYQVVKAKGNVDFTESLMNITVDSLKDSALLYVVHNWIAPERTANTPKNVKLSSDRYWTVDGIFNPGYHATALIQYDGRTLSSAYNGGFLDNDFLKGVKEDSIVLMYKPVVGGDWTLLNVNKDYTVTTGTNHTDEFGDIKILNLKKGQYCFGIYDYRAGIAPISMNNYGMVIYPNPASDKLHIRFNSPVFVQSIQVFDSNGKLVKSIANPASGSGDILIQNIHLPDGVYILEANTAAGQSSMRFVIKN